MSNTNPDGHSRYNKDTPTAFQNMSEEAHKAAAANGGRKSGESRRRKKSIRECLKMLGQMQCTPREMETIKKAFPELADDEMTKNCLVSAAMYQKAAAGDTQAFGKITETTGEKTLSLAGDPDNPVATTTLSIAKIKDLNTHRDRRPPPPPSVSEKRH